MAEKGLLDSLGEGLTSGDFLSGAFQALAGTAGLLFQSSSEEDARKDAQALQDKKDKLALQLEALKIRYGQGGGGGGGGGSAMQLTPAQRLNTIQNQGTAQSNAIQNLISAMQSGYSMGA